MGNNGLPHDFQSEFRFLKHLTMPQPFLVDPYTVFIKGGLILFSNMVLCHLPFLLTTTFHATLQTLLDLIVLSLVFLFVFVNILIVKFALFFGWCNNLRNSLSHKKYHKGYGIDIIKNTP